jgi:hypothetical protein
MPYDASIISTHTAPLDPWLLATLKMRLGSAMNSDEALALARQRMSEKRQNVRAETPVKVILLTRFMFQDARQGIVWSLQDQNMLCIVLLVSCLCNRIMKC